jgi:hypothetical protein
MPQSLTDGRNEGGRRFVVALVRSYFEPIQSCLGVVR